MITTNGTAQALPHRMKLQFMKLTTLLLSTLFLFSCSTAQLQTLDGLLGKAKKVLPTSESEVGNGLKEALEIGVSKGADALSQTDGYMKSPYKILLPAEAQTVINKLKVVPGFQNLESDLTERLNRAAEDAAQKAKPIFMSAIKQMTIKDAMSILMGQKNAATQYLDRTTRPPLYDEFHPVILESLEKVNAVSLWSSATTAYNKLPFVKAVDTRLDAHVTNKALDGLFAKVELEELNIRTNLSSRSSDLLKRVFARQDK